MSNQIQISNYKFQIILYIIFLTYELNSQVIDTDTSDVVIRKTSIDKPFDFSISDVIIKLDKEKKNFIVRADLDIPVSTSLKLNITDSNGAIIMYLINAQTLKAGIYRVKWQMEKCNDNDCSYPPGRYYCSFETDQFIYQKDFYIK